MDDLDRIVEIQQHYEAKLAEKERELMSERYRRDAENRKLVESIPYLSFPANWKIKISPNFGGSTCRFRVTTDRMNGENISVYLDCNQALGWHNDEIGYWEVYPYEEDTFRCGVEETDELLKAIQESVDKIELEYSDLSKTLRGE